ncbi:MAG: type II toxin-antitoxin system RelE/ParE family toxin [Nitrospirota bacterium]
MGPFTLKLSPAATHDLDQLDDKTAGMVLDHLPVLKENPFPRGKLIKKLKGKKATFYRLRVDKYRLYYTLEGSVVAIMRVISKKDAEKFIKQL